MSDEEKDVSDQYPDCFKENEYGPSGGNCPECGTDDYEIVKERSQSDMLSLRCVSCLQIYHIREDLVDGDPVSP